MNTVAGFLHRGHNVIDTLQPDHAYSLAARVRELEAALRKLDQVIVQGIHCGQIGSRVGGLRDALAGARRALKGAA